MCGEVRVCVHVCMRVSVYVLQLCVVCVVSCVSVGCVSVVSVCPQLWLEFE